MTKLKFSLIAMLSLITILCAGLFIGTPFKNKPLTAHAAETEEKTLIDLVEATVTVPVAGETIDTTATVSETLYKITKVDWFKGTEVGTNAMNKYSRFVEGQQYTVSVKFQVTSLSSYAFDKENIGAKINGMSADVVSVFPAFVTVKYTFTVDAEPLPKYSVTVENGTLEDGNTTGMFEEGEEVTVIADSAPEGKVLEWIVVSGEVEIYKEYDEETTFYMGDSDVIVRAVYKTIVDLVELTIKTPVAGVVADNNNDLSYPTGKGYTATMIWYNEDWSELAEGATFVLGVGYLVEIEVNISPDYIFTDDTQAYLNGVDQLKFDAFPHSFIIKEIYIAGEKAPVYFDVKVTGGRAEIDESIVIKAESGKEITIIAEPAEGQMFEKWEVVSGGITLANATNETTAFTMPDGNVEVKAVYKTVHVHTLVRVDEKPATCAVTGIKAHYTCSGCELLFDINDDKTEVAADSLVIAINPNTHDLEEKWTSSKEGHYHVCKNGCAAGRGDITAHTPDRSEATETQPVKCTVCGYIIKPAAGHTHSLTEVPGVGATCTAEGRKTYFKCDGCEAKFADEAGEEQITDESTLVIPMAHRFGEWEEEISATTEREGVKAHKTCDFCGKHFDKDDNEIEDITIAKLPAEDSSSGDSSGSDSSVKDSSGEQIKPENKNEGLSGGAIAGIVIGSVVVAGAGGFSVFWFVIKKKSFAELIGSIKGLFKKK